MGAFVQEAKKKCLLYLCQKGEMQQKETPKVRAYLTEAESLGVGLFGGALETTILMPFVTWKFTIQDSRPLPKTLNGWYRGVFAQAGSVAPITALQVVTTGIIEKMITGGTRNL